MITVEERREIAHRLPYSGGSMGDLAPYLADPDATVRNAALYSIALCDGTYADLVPFFHDTEWRVQQTAIELIPKFLGRGLNNADVLARDLAEIDARLVTKASDMVAAIRRQLAA